MILPDSPIHNAVDQLMSKEYSFWKKLNFDEISIKNILCSSVCLDKCHNKIMMSHIFQNSIAGMADAVCSLAGLYATVIKGGLENTVRNVSKS